ncbi:MAG TPA: phosphoglycerate mutase family protein [Actinomycetota bacterium]
MRELEVRRHAEREKDRDALTPAGRAMAEDLGRRLPTDYAYVFVSPAQRAAETVAWFLRGSGQALPGHAVVPGLGSEAEDRWRAAAREAGSPRIDAVAETDPELVAAESARLADAVRAMADEIADGSRALAVGHSPLIEAAVYGLLHLVIEPLDVCEGVRFRVEGQDQWRIQELRLPPT